MASSSHRKAFVFGAFLGAAAGAAAAVLNAPQSGHHTRTQIQQSVEGLLFRVLDMTPFESTPTDIVQETQPTVANADLKTPPVDILVGSRPSEVSAQ